MMMTKYPLKRVEANVTRAITVLEIDLSRLDQHRQNIQKFEARGEARSVREEHVKAGSTVQQLKANLRALHSLKLQVQDEDLAKFDAKTREIYERAAGVTSQFGHVADTEPASGGNLVINTQGFSSESPLDSADVYRDWESPHTHDKNMASHVTGVTQMQLEANSEDETEETWRTLETSVLELNGLVRDFSTLVHEQGAAVDSIEDNIASVAENVDEGTSSLAKAAKYSAAVYPVAGALVGTLVGGPVGFVAGLKVGALAAAGGSLAGFTGGRFLQRKKTQQVDCDEQVRMSEHSQQIKDSDKEDSAVNQT